MTKKRKWRTRTSGTSRQVGQHFVIDDESQQSRKARLPSASFIVPRKKSILSNPLRHKSEEEKLSDERRKRLKELAEKKKHEKKLFGQPIEEHEEPTVDEQIREEAGEVKKVVLEIDYDVKTDWHKLSNWLKNSRVGHFFSRKKEERTS